MQRWRVSEARASFATVLERARTTGPQLIVNRDQVVAAVVGEESARRLELTEASDASAPHRVKHALEQLRQLRAQAIAEGVLSLEDNVGLEAEPLDLGGFQDPFGEDVHAPIPR